MKGAAGIEQEETELTEKAEAEESDPARLKAYNLSLKQVFDALANGNRNALVTLPAGAQAIPR